MLVFLLETDSFKFNRKFDGVKCAPLSIQALSVVSVNP